MLFEKGGGSMPLDVLGSMEGFETLIGGFFRQMSGFGS